ncbi:type II secretion system protein M [Parvularcula flava]|uniref:Type II secretion system protein M n=1 Tax=Aquisalinus luteolus TaxID=1566827 RepID=A0A8J3A3I3_9PROT|nr:type II secretion system protein GspM [Aquisalinus luteolus]NHK29080.1 type II secretion system protein M [Aquisalinus luteolus]GGI00373.1 hypothetical protein GCM10011355_28510 [Aquisalinus luteolus]
MSNWWQTLSRRERTMLMAMAILLVLFLVYFALMRPLFAWRTSGELALQNAQSTAILVDRATANARTGSGGQGAAATGSALRGIITASASANDIPVSAFQLSQSGASVIISIENIPASRLYGWLGQLETERNIRVSEARISRARFGESTVQARLTLSQGN